jgi:hypothetical protein
MDYDSSLIAEACDYMSIDALDPTGAADGSSLPSDVTIGLLHPDPNNPYDFLGSSNSASGMGFYTCSSRGSLSRIVAC